jgi:hypothetical protein
MFIRSVTVVTTFPDMSMSFTQKISLAAIFQLSDQAICVKVPPRKNFVQVGGYVQNSGNSGNSTTQPLTGEGFNLLPLDPENWKQSGNNSGNSHADEPLDPPQEAPREVHAEATVGQPLSPRDPWPTPLPGEETIAGLPIRRCPSCGRQMFWIRPGDPPVCIGCTLDNHCQHRKGGRMI